MTTTDPLIDNAGLSTVRDRLSAAVYALDGNELDWTWEEAHDLFADILDDLDETIGTHRGNPAMELARLADYYRDGHYRPVELRLRLKPHDHYDDCDGCTVCGLDDES